MCAERVHSYFLNSIEFFLNCYLETITKYYNMHCKNKYDSMSYFFPRKKKQLALFTQRHITYIFLQQTPLSLSHNVNTYNKHIGNLI